MGYQRAVTVSITYLIFIHLAPFATGGTRKVSKRNFERSATCPLKCRLDPNTQACVQSQWLSSEETAVPNLCTRYLQHRFDSISDCTAKCDNCDPDRMISKCTRSVLDKRFSICTEKPAIGPCRARFPMWYYNSGAGQCKIFYYGGCRGNDNRFNSELDCLIRCGLYGFGNEQKSQILEHTEL